MDCRYVAVPASRRTSRAGARQQLLDASTREGRKSLDPTVAFSIYWNN